MNWRGRPLTSHEVVVELIAATTTGRASKCTRSATLGTIQGVSVPKSAMTEIDVHPHDFHGDWNYRLAGAAALQ